MDKDYSKREIDTHFETLNHSISDVGVAVGNVDLKVEAVSTKVGIQNGRVFKLEKKNAWMTGIGVAAMVFVGLIITLVVYSFKLSQDNLRQSIIIELRK